MPDSFVQVATDGSGKKVQTFENTVNGVANIHANAVALVGSTGAPVGTTASPLYINDYDSTTSGTITTTDAVVTAPAGDGTFRAGTSTAGSYVSIACPGGDSAWNVGLTGTWTGTVYYEGSPDSTNGVDGNWININGRQTGIVNTVLSGNATANGMYRGNTSGLTYFRVRRVGASTGSITVRINISAGTGATFLNASIPAGTNNIGDVDIVSVPAITKGTQGSTGLTVQNLKDAGRAHVSVNWELMTGTAAAESALTNYTSASRGGTALAAATSLTVTAGKTLRIQTVTITLLENATTAIGRFRIRQAATVANTSPIIFDAVLGSFSGTAAAKIGQTQVIAIPDGLEVAGGQQITFTWFSDVNTCTLSMTILGYEY